MFGHEENYNRMREECDLGLVGGTGQRLAYFKPHTSITLSPSASPLLCVKKFYMSLPVLHG